MEERLTVCNMSIEGGARVGYVNPDEATIDYLRGRPYAPAGAAFERAAAWWRSMASDASASYDDRVELDGTADLALGHLGDQPGPERGGGRVHPALGRPARRRAPPPRGGPGAHEAAPRRADRRHPHRRRVHRLVHQRPHLRPARGGARRPDRARGAGRAHAGGTGLPSGGAPGRGRGPAGGVSHRRLRLARGGLLHVPGDEPRQARRRRDQRLVEQPQLQGPPGLAQGAHAPDVPRDGGAAALAGRVRDVREVL